MEVNEFLVVDGLATAFFEVFLVLDDFPSAGVSGVRSQTLK